MTLYDLMIKTNHYLLKDGELTEAHKQNIVNQFLSGVSTQEQTERFYTGVKFPKNIDSEGRRMYPIYYIPPYNNNKKLKTIYNQTPKTHIFSANMYELEIIRLLHLLSPDNPTIKNMVQNTHERLKTTCFGNMDDGTGECFDASIVVLRFLAATKSEDSNWINSRIDSYNNHINDKKRPSFANWYFWLCLSELPFELAKPELIKYKGVMSNWLKNKSCVMNSEHDQTIHPLLFTSLRNCLSNFPEYSYIKDRKPYVSDKDGRLHFDMQPT